MERGFPRSDKRYNLNTPAIMLYVAGVSLACWIACYLTPSGFPLTTSIAVTPLWNVLANLFPNIETAYAAGLVFVLGGAFLLNRANYALMLIRERTILPFLLYLLYVSTNPDFIPLKASSISVVCLILAIYLLFKSYHEEQSVGNAYRAALLIAVGSLLWIHILWFLPLFWRGMYNFKAWTPKTWAASLLGLGTVYWFVFGWCVWQQDYSLITQPFAQLFRFNLFHFHDLGLIDWLSAILIGLITLAATIHILTNELEDNLRTRQFLWFFILFAAWSLVPFILYAQSSDEFLQILCIPAALLTAHFFTLERNRFTFGLFHLMVVSCVALLFIRIWNF